MAQLRRNEQCRHASLAGQFQSALDERHGQVGIVLVAARAGRPEPAVSLGETLAERTRQRLAPHPRRISENEVESAGRHHVGEVHRVVKGGEAAVTRESSPGRAQLAQFGSRTRRAPPSPRAPVPAAPRTASRRAPAPEGRRSSPPLPRWTAPVTMPPPRSSARRSARSAGRFAPPAAVMAECLARRSSAAAAASGRCSPCRLQSVSPWRTTASRFGSGGMASGSDVSSSAMTASQSRSSASRTAVGSRSTPKRFRARTRRRAVASGLVRAARERGDPLQCAEEECP